MYLAAKVVSSTERSDSQGTSSRSQVHGRNGGEDQVCGGIRCRLNNNGRFTDGGVDLRGEGGRKWEPRSGGGDGAEVRLMDPANLGGRAAGVHAGCEGEEGAREVVCVGNTLWACPRKEPVGVSCRPTRDSASGSAGAGERVGGWMAA